MKKKTKYVLVAGVPLLVLGGFAVLNMLAYRHARSMTHFTRSGRATPKPELLSFGQKIKVLFSGANIPRPASESTPAAAGLKFQDHKIHCDNGIRLAAWHIPGKQPGTLVIIFHGYAAEKSKLLIEAGVFHRLGHSVLLVDFRGSGGSSEASTSIGFFEADDVAGTVRYAKAKLPHDRLVLFGPSMGGAAILGAIHRHKIKPDAIIIEAVFDTMLNTIRNRFDDVPIPSFPSAQLLVFWGGRQLGFNGFAHKPRDYAKSVQCPALIMHGALDPKVRVEEAQRVFAAIPAVKEFKLFPRAGHGSYAAASPSEWESTVARFISEAPPAPRPPPDI